MFTKVQGGKEVDKDAQPPVMSASDNDYSVTAPLQNEEALSLNIENSQNPGTIMTANNQYEGHDLEAVKVGSQNLQASQSAMAPAGAKKPKN